MGIKNKIARLTNDKRELHHKALQIKNAWDDVSHIVGEGKSKRKKKK